MVETVPEDNNDELLMDDELMDDVMVETVTYVDDSNLHMTSPETVWMMPDKEAFVFTSVSFQQNCQANCQMFGKTSAHIVCTSLHGTG